MKPSARLVRARDKSPESSTRPRAAAPPIPGFTPRSEDVYAHYLRRIAPERLVLGAGLLTLAIYFGFVLAFPITEWWNQPHASTDPAQVNDLGRITGYSPAAAMIFVGAILALFACQFFALVGVGQLSGDVPARSVDRMIQRSVLLFPLAFAAVMIWMQPVTTTDLYGYVARGYLYAHLHHNPMTTPAVLLPGGLQVNRPAAPYGPAWLLIAGLISRTFGDNLLAIMLAYKAIAFVFVAAALTLVDWLARRLYPERRLRIDVLFGWSPLLIFESLGNGHNDIVMVVCVLAALALMVKGRARTAFALLVLGALVKYFSAVFVALWLAYELRHRVRPAAEAVATTGDGQRVRRWLSVVTRFIREVDRRDAVNLLVSVFVIGLALVVAFYAPFWTGFKTFTGLSQQIQPLYYNGSIIGFLAGPLALLVPTHAEQAALDKVIRLVCYAMFAGYIIIQVRRLWLRGPTSDVRDVITAGAKLTFVALLLITFWYQPWYVVWILPFAALTEDAFVRRAGTVLALGSLLTYAVGNFVLVQETGVGRDLFVQFFEILVTFGPLLLLRTSPNEQGWRGIARRYVGMLGTGLREQSVLIERVMLALIVLVAVILRLVRLGNLFVEAPPTGAAADVLKQASGDLRLFLSDPQGLQGPFVAVEGMLVSVFGRTPFAALLPSAILGSLTVLMIYAVTVEVMSRPGGPKKRSVALLAALLAATSNWHVSLSRSGMEVVALPLLLCVAVYFLLMALRTRTQPAQRPNPPPRQVVHTQPRRARGRRRSLPVPRDPVAGQQRQRAERKRTLLLIGSGVATGLACDVAPGLWLVPLVVIGVLLAWRWHQNAGSRLLARNTAILVGSTAMSGIPVIWYFASRAIGFPAGNAVLAHTSSPPPTGPGLLSLAFWGQVAHNASDVVGLLVSQDYSAGYPAVGGTPIIPSLLGPLFYIGLVIIMVRWRELSSLALLMLVALPLVASVAVGTPTGVIEAASVLPAMCIIPAVAIYEIAAWLGHLPIVLDRVNGVRIFTTPEQIGRVLLFIFLLASALRTFYWYFEVTLPTSGPNQFVPSLAPSHLVWANPGDSSDLTRGFASHGIRGNEAYNLVRPDTLQPVGWDATREVAG